MRVAKYRLVGRQRPGSFPRTDRASPFVVHQMAGWKDREETRQRVCSEGVHHMGKT